MKIGFSGRKRRKAKKTRKVKADYLRRNVPGSAKPK